MRAGFAPLLLTAAVGAALVSLPASAFAEPAEPHRARIGTRLAAALEAVGEATELVAIRVSLQSGDLPRPGAAGRQASVAARQQRVINALSRHAISVDRRYVTTSGFSLSATPHAIEALSRHPEVVSIHLNGEVHANIAQGGALIGAPAAHALGYTGDGINVAVIDTGIDTDHVGLEDDIVAEACFCNNHPSPQRGCCPGGGATESGAGAAEDDNGHGTNVSGVITSIFGIAPDSGVVAVKVLSSTGSGLDSDIDAALDWVLTNHATHAIRVVNMSLGDGGQYNDPNVSSCFGNPTANAIRDLALAGVATFAASGNEGHDNGISSPACSADAISVGGVYDASMGAVGWCSPSGCGTILCQDATAPDRFVCHSNSDELLDVLAPDWKTTTSDIGGGSTNFGGTSAASPYAAASAALLFEAEPTLTPALLRTRMKTFGPMVTNSDNGLSFRRTDLGAALQDLVAECGNSILDTGETCDDGNTASGDCCSATCQVEAFGNSCDDGDACTSTDVCDGAGTCGGTAITCDDTNFCTDDACDPGLGCTFTPNVAPCDDADACTDGDTCSAGSCVSGTPVTCNDTNTCTDDACDPGLGCTFTPNVAPCDDSDACTDGDTCSAGSCASGEPLSCDDANPCTAEACDSIDGCTHAIVPGCAAGVVVPAIAGWGRLLLMISSLGAGVAVLRRRSSTR